MVRKKTPNVVSDVSNLIVKVSPKTQDTGQVLKNI